MCGIAGVLYSDADRAVRSEILTSMGNSIAHRGPDGEGTFRAGPIGLVHRRLAIIDLNGGQQPLCNEDASVHVVFNGEIYNYQQLRGELLSRGHVFRTHSDTEVLVHLYEEHGADLCRHLRGMFAFAIWDARRRELLLARDHLGQKPLYVYQDQEKIVFGSELKAILAHPGIDRQTDVRAIEDYLTFGFIPGQRSIFSSIRKIAAAHVLQVSMDQWNAKSERYWHLSFDREESGTADSWKEKIGSALRESVGAHLIADVPVGAFLSGGLDSSSIVALMSELLAEPVPVFSIGFQEEAFSELQYAREVARHFQCIHYEQVVTPEAIRDLDDLTFLYDEPFADSSAIPTMAVSRLASQHVKVVLSGDGGDELFGGYSRYSHDLSEAKIRELIPAALRSLIVRPLAAIWPRADWLPRPLRLKTLLQNLSLSPAEAYANTVSTCRSALRKSVLNRDLLSSLQGHRPEELVVSAFEHGHRDTLSGMLSADTNVLLPDDFLTKVDRASMGFGLEVRPPLIDWKLMELAASMPSDLKIRGGAKKWILRQLFSARLPDNLVNRRKQGFEIPIDQWLCGPLREQVESCVLDPRSPVSRFIDVAFVRTLYRAHCQGRGRHGQLIWSLLVLARWMDAWGRPESAASGVSTGVRGPAFISC